MSYRKNIIKLSHSRVEPIKYFIDANVWIYAMQNPNSLKHWENKYANFFFDIIDSDLDPQPKIILPSLLISEIINTYLRQIALSEYKRDNGISAIDKFDFKRNYRTTQHYKDNLEQICDDILGYKSSIDFVSDDLMVKNPEIILNVPSSNFDYNDYIYYCMCQNIGATTSLAMITNDSDMDVSDIKILTENRTLLAL
jgi:predicted nucleic acid-binding protein